MSYLLCDHHVALELLMAFVPSVLALTSSFTTASDRHIGQEEIRLDLVIVTQAGQYSLINRGAKHKRLPSNYVWLKAEG